MEDRRIGIEIRIIANLIGRSLNEIGAIDKHLTGPQGLILLYLYDHQDTDVFQKDLEFTFNIRRSSATGLLQCLETNGFIKRVGVDYDARLKKIILTPKAKEHQISLEKNLRGIEATLVKGLSDEDIAHFIKIIGKIRKNLE